MHMNQEITILSVELDADDGLVVIFSDGTTAGYLVEELLALRPLRLHTRKSPTNVDWTRSEPPKP